MSAHPPLLTAHVLQPEAPTWAAQVDALWTQLGYPANPELFPAYFIKTTFPKLGGRLFQLADAAGRTVGAAVLFPRAMSDSTRYVTLRLHAPLVSPADVLAAIAPQIAPDEAVLYRPSDGRTFPGSTMQLGAYSIGAPTSAEVSAIIDLQRAVWGDEAGHGYPGDLHSREFAPGSSLVARMDGRVAGFLFGFTRFTAPTGLPTTPNRLYLESQLLAIDPAHRGSGLAAALKRAQAVAAIKAGIHAIHWTADPLQRANALLNFAGLRAVSGTVYPSYYPFTNALNRVAASRLGIVWLPASAHGSAGLAAGSRSKKDLTAFPGIVVLNDGPVQRTAAADAPAIAIAIPSDWTALQHAEPELAQAWRTTTDAVLGAHLGFTAGRYLITDVAREGENWYLVGERSETVNLTPQ
jgi:predicted GNAT superfamily acetyltransferase